MAQALTPPTTAPRTTAATAARRRQLALRLLLILGALAAIWLALAPFTAVPEPLPATAPATQFSAGRALADVTFIAAAPHPVGSDRQAVVRDYLLGQIRALGLEPQIQRERVAGNAFSGVPTLIEVENLLVRLPGSNSQGTILISGHYDSVPTSGGAADCAACTATTLETLRAIANGPRLQNDVIFLFTDGEEVGIAGADAFASRHPWMDDVVLTLVHEGLGSGGAALLYANSAGSGPLLAEALAAAPSPRAYSLINDLMWNVQGNTGSDLDAFVARGSHGLAFVNLSLEGATAYHTMLDNAQTLDPGTVQHHGDYALALVRHFGNRAWDEPLSAGDRVTFPLAPGLNLSYPDTLALPLVLGAAVLYLGLLLWGWRRRRLSLKRFLAGTVLFFLALFLATVVGAALWWLIRWFNPALHSYFVGGWYGSTLYLLALLAAALAVTATVLFPLTQVLRRAEIWAAPAASFYAGILFWWVLSALLSARALPGLSYLFLWPLLAALALLAWHWARPATAGWPLVRALALLLPALVALILFVPALYVLAILGARLEAILGLPLYVLPLPFAILLFGLLLPQLSFLLGQRIRRLAPGLLLLAAALLLVAGLRAGFDPAHPGTDSITYLLDADAGTARWLTVDDSRAGRGTRAQLDPWTAQFFPDGGEETTFSPWLSGMMAIPQPALGAPAPLADLAASSVAVVADASVAGRRRLALHVTPPADALDGTLSLSATGAATFASATLEGNALRLADPHTFDVDIYGRPGPYTLEVEMVGEGALSLTVRDRYLGLPRLDRFPIAERPASLMPAPFNRTADSQIVVSTHSFE